MIGSFKAHVRNGKYILKTKYKPKCCRGVSVEDFPSGCARDNFPAIFQLHVVHTHIKDFIEFMLY